MTQGNQYHCIIEDLLERNFNSRSSDEQTRILKHMRPMPNLELITNSASLISTFSNNIYTDIKWICACQKRKLMFCWPCLILSSEKSIWNESGFTDFDNIYKAKRSHEDEIAHIDAFIKLRQILRESTKKITPITTITRNENFHRTIECNKYIIAKMIDIMCLVLKEELLISHLAEKSNAENTKNYLKLLSFLSMGDEKLKACLRKSTSVTNDLRSVLNNVIKSMARILKIEIKKEIQKAKFTSIILEKADKMPFMNTMIRYVDEKGILQERFVGFSKIKENKDCDSLIAHIQNFSEEYDLKKSLIGISYDEAVITHLDNIVVQEKICEISKVGMFLHHSTLRLDVICLQSVRHMKELKSFFKLLDAFSSFFDKKTRTYRLLNLEIRKTSLKVIQYENHTETVEFILEYDRQIRNTLIEIASRPQDWKTESVATANNLNSLLNNADVVFLLQAFIRIFKKANTLSEILQNRYLEVDFCVGKINEFEKYLVDQETEFNKIWKNVESLQIFVSVQPNKRLKIEDVRSKKEFYRELYKKITSTLKNVFNVRFNNIDMVRFMSLLNTDNFHSYESNFPSEIFNLIQYEGLFNMNKLKKELHYIYNCNFFKNKTLEEIKTTLATEDLSGDILGELYKFIELVYAAPNTVQPIFSTSNKINTYLNHFQFADLGSFEEPSSYLALLFIEEKFLNHLHETLPSAFIKRITEDLAINNQRYELFLPNELTT